MNTPTAPSAPTVRLYICPGCDSAVTGVYLSSDSAEDIAEFDRKHAAFRRLEVEQGDPRNRMAKCRCRELMTAQRAHPQPAGLPSAEDEDEDYTPAPVATAADVQEAWAEAHRSVMADRDVAVARVSALEAELRIACAALDCAGYEPCEPPLNWDLKPGVKERISALEAERDEAKAGLTGSLIALGEVRARADRAESALTEQLQVRDEINESLRKAKNAAEADAAGLREALTAVEVPLLTGQTLSIVRLRAAEKLPEADDVLHGIRYNHERFQQTVDLVRKALAPNPGAALLAKMAQKDAALRECQHLLKWYRSATPSLGSQESCDEIQARIDAALSDAPSGWVSREEQFNAAEEINIQRAEEIRDLRAQLATANQHATDMAEQRAALADNLTAATERERKLREALALRSLAAGYDAKGEHETADKFLPQAAAALAPSSTAQAGFVLARDAEGEFAIKSKPATPAAVEPGGAWEEFRGDDKTPAGPGVEVFSTELAELRRKVEAGAADSARLDWLEARRGPEMLGWEVRIAPAGNAQITRVFVGSKSTLRAAIDAAQEGGSHV